MRRLDTRLRRKLSSFNCRQDRYRTDLITWRLLLRLQLRTRLSEKCLGISYLLRRWTYFKKARLILYTTSAWSPLKIILLQILQRSWNLEWILRVLVNQHINSTILWWLAPLQTVFPPKKGRKASFPQEPQTTCRDLPTKWMQWQVLFQPETSRLWIPLRILYYESSAVWRDLVVIWLTLSRRKSSVPKMLKTMLTLRS